MPQPAMESDAEGAGKPARPRTRSVHHPQWERVGWRRAEVGHRKAATHPDDCNGLGRCGTFGFARREWGGYETLATLPREETSWL